jgi:hypothetical protein
VRWRLFPRLLAPDWPYWEEHFPEGLGSSVFSSPGWLRLMQQRMGPPWHIRFIRAETDDGQTLSVPALVKTDRLGRSDITVRDLAACVMPIEDVSRGCERAMAALLDAVRSAWATGCVCWFPPWCAWRGPQTQGEGCELCSQGRTPAWCSLRPSTSSDRCWLGTVTWSSTELFVITLRGSSQEHLANRVERTQRQHLRASLRAGLEVITEPSPEEIDEYYAMYSRIFDERSWIPPKLPASFFHEVRWSWAKGGELVLMRYQGRIVGGGVYLYDRHSLYVYQATTDRAAKGVYPHPVLYQRAIERAESRGLRYVNLGHNPDNPGLIRFKRDWGAEPMPAPMLRWRGGVRCMSGNAWSRIRTLTKGGMARR